MHADSTQGVTLYHHKDTADGHTRCAWRRASTELAATQTIRTV